jgi:hypothetical protein
MKTEISALERNHKINPSGKDLALQAISLLGKENGI